MNRARTRLTAAVSAALIATPVIAAALFALPAGAAEQTPGARDVSEHACPPDRVPDSGFVDIAGNTFEDEIECLAWYGITTGGPEGLPANRYGPGLEVSRGQMAAFIARTLDYVVPDVLPAYDGDNDFSDVPDDYTHVAAINRLADAEVVKGGPGGAPPDIYGPELDVNRDQMASFIARSYNYVFEVQICDNEALPDYFDDDETSVHESCINALADMGIVQGRSFGVYDPLGHVQRDQMSAFIMRTVDFYVEHEIAVPPDEQEQQA